MQDSMRGMVKKIRKFIRTKAKVSAIYWNSSVPISSKRNVHLMLLDRMRRNWSAEFFVTK